MAATESSMPPLSDLNSPGGLPWLPAASTKHLAFDTSRLLVGCVLAIIIPFILPVVIGKDGKNAKQRALTCDVGGEPGFTKHNQHFLSLIETPWEGANTMASLFELAYQQYSGNHLLGTRELIKQETELSKDGKAFEKLTLGNDQ